MLCETKIWVCRRLAFWTALSESLRRERNRLHAVASRKRRREKSEALEAENASLKAENDALRAEVQRLRVQNARLVDPVSVNAAAAIVSDASGPLADENAAAWLGMSA